jgi:esterase/lipase superfamily enzyme
MIEMMRVSLRRRFCLLAATPFFMFTVPSFSQDLDRCQELTATFPSAEAAAGVRSEFQRRFPNGVPSNGTDPTPWLDAIEAQQCWMERKQPDPLANATKTRGGQLRVYRTPVLFATDRRIIGRPIGPDKLDAEVGNSTNLEELTFGSGTILIPSDRVGADQPPLRNWQAPNSVAGNNYYRFDTLQEVRNDGDFSKLLTDALEGSPAKRLLVFVHGFDTTFSDAATRAAQLTVDLSLSDPLIFYSWPSHGGLLGVRFYPSDEDKVEQAVPGLVRLLRTLSALHPNELIIIAHSMGCRIVVKALTNLALLHQAPQGLKRIILMAPDVEPTDFSGNFLTHRADLGAVAIYVYGSNIDLAMWASGVFHSGQRLGTAPPPVPSTEGLELIDASANTPWRREFGHAYVFDSAAVQRDLRSIIFGGLGAERRGLNSERNPKGNGVYWVID